MTGSIKWITFRIIKSCHCEPKGRACTPKCHVFSNHSTQALRHAGVAISLWDCFVATAPRNDNLFIAFVLVKSDQFGVFDLKAPNSELLIPYQQTILTSF